MRRSLLAAAAALAALAASNPCAAKGQPAKPPAARAIKATQPQAREPSNRELQAQIEQLSALVVALSGRVAELQDAVGTLYQQDSEDHADAIEGLEETCEAVVRHNNVTGLAGTHKPESYCRFGNSPPIGVRQPRAARLKTSARPGFQLNEQNTRFVEATGRR